MKLNLGNGHTWKRRLDDARYLPADTVRRARSARERWLAAWAGYSPGQRLSSLGLASAVVIALLVIATGGGEGGTDLIVTENAGSASDGRAVPARARRDVDPQTSSSIDDTTAPAAGTAFEPTLIDDSAVVAEPDGKDRAKVLAATTIAGKPKPKPTSEKVTANRSALAVLLEAALKNAPKPASTSAASPSAPAPSPGPAPPSPAPGSPPAATRPPATSPPTTRPPATSPPTTRPPVTAPPTTRPPTTVPPTTAPPTAPPTTAPPTTEPPITVPPITFPPITFPPITAPPTTAPDPDPPRPTPPEV